jgi:hypothetical protein
MVSLTQAVESLRTLEAETTLIPGIDPETGASLQVEAPAYLFRGEADIRWETTASSMRRFVDDESFSSSTREMFVSATKALDRVLQTRGLHPMYSAALLQHYGLPTDVLDLTSSVSTAASFATYKYVGPGRIMCFSLDSLRSELIVIDLRRLSFARRPRLQQAYVIFHKSEPNLKAGKLVEKLQPRMISFEATRAELKAFDRNDELWGLPDPTSGLLNMIARDEVIPNMDLSEEMRSQVCAMIDARVPWSPVPMRPVDNGFEPAWDQF